MAVTLIVTIQLLEKTGAPSCVTGNTPNLFNFQQHHVVVAIQPDFADVLNMAGFLALAPQLVARA